MRRIAVASTWAHECRMRSSSVNFARSSGDLRSLGSWFSSGIDGKVLTADERRWTQMDADFLGRRRRRIEPGDWSNRRFEPPAEVLEISYLRSSASVCGC